MQLNNLHRCIIRVGFDRATVLKNLPKKDENRIIKNNIRLEDVMEVTFIPNTHFSITAINSSPKQVVEKGYATEWNFDVSPKHVGEYPLTFIIKIILPNGNKEEVLKESILVGTEQTTTSMERFDKTFQIEYEVPPFERIKILMLTANPANSIELNLLDKEHSQIAIKLQGKTDKFALNIQKAVNKTEFKELTETAKPDVLHFSGHGTRGEDGNGIVLQNDNKNGYEIITTQRLNILFKYFKGFVPLKAVFLNACYSAEQAKVIAKYVPYVIGTTKEIEDEYAASFSVGFYFKLVESGGDFEQAYTSGRTEAALAGAEEKDFVLYKNGKKVNIK